MADTGQDESGLEAQRNTPRDVKFVQVVTIPNRPATAPERVTPISAVSSGQVSWSPPHLTPQANVLTGVVFRPCAQRVGKPCGSIDAAYAGTECVSTETEEKKRSHLRFSRR